MYRTARTVQSLEKKLRKNRAHKSLRLLHFQQANNVIKKPRQLQNDYQNQQDDDLLDNS